MSGVQCPHCRQWTEDLEFCDHCGREVKASVSKAPLSLAPNIMKWQEYSLQCDTVLLSGTLNWTMLPPPSECIELPLHINTLGTAGGCLYFPKNEHLQPLPLFLEHYEALDMAFIFKIIKRVGLIMYELHQAGFILGTFDLSDFWVADQSIDKLKLRITRPLFLKGEPAAQVKLGEFCAPELYNVHPLYPDSDVILLGNLCITLSLKRRTAITDYNELRYLSHQMKAFRPEFPVMLHRWLAKSTEIDCYRRYITVRDQLDDLDRMLQESAVRHDLLGSHKEKSLGLDYHTYGGTHVGVGKVRDVELETDDSGNQDHFFIDTDHELGVAIAVVADGISNCKYGSGLIASRRITELLAIAWRGAKATLLEPEAIRAFFADMIKFLNDEVVTEAAKLIPTEESGKWKEPVAHSDLMGSTLVLVILTGGRMYAVSIGDSRLYLLVPSSGLTLLLADENVMNERLRTGSSTWYETIEEEQKSSLTHYIGMADVSCGRVKPIDPPFNIVEMGIMQGDVILLCSDGLTDYLGPLGHRNDLWKADNYLEGFLQESYEDTRRHEESKLDLAGITHALIDAANQNGGGDNITVVLIQPISSIVEGNDHDERTGD